MGEGPRRPRCRRGREVSRTCGRVDDARGRHRRRSQRRASAGAPIRHYRILTKEQPAATARLVAKRKLASTISGEQSDRQLSASASRKAGP
jgi:hypothetical protein